MGLDIWFREDIYNALLAANEANAATTMVIAEVSEDLQLLHDPARALPLTLRVYREGYKAALSTVALAFGISPQAVLGGPDGQDATDEGEGVREAGCEPDSVWASRLRLPEP